MPCVITTCLQITCCRGGHNLCPPWARNRSMEPNGCNIFATTKLAEVITIRDHLAPCLRDLPPQRIARKQVAEVPARCNHLHRSRSPLRRGPPPRPQLALLPGVEPERLLHDLARRGGAAEPLDDDLLVLEDLVVLEEGADLAHGVARQLLDVPDALHRRVVQVDADDLVVLLP